MEEIREVVEKTCSLLQDDLQAKWSLLTTLVAQKMSYSLSLQYPSDMMEAARKIAVGPGPVLPYCGHGDPLSPVQEAGLGSRQAGV